MEKAKTKKGNESEELKKLLKIQNKLTGESIRLLENLTGIADRYLGGGPVTGGGNIAGGEIRPQGSTFNSIIEEVEEQGERIGALSERMDDLEEIQYELDNNRLERMENDIDWLQRKMTDLLRRVK